MPLRLVVSGATGRMGSALARLIGEADDMVAAGGIAPGVPPTGSAHPGYPELRRVEDANALVRSADVVVDFSAPSQLRALLELQGSALKGRALVVGTTGLDAELEGCLDRVAMDSPVVVAPNFAIGVNLLLGLVERAARSMGADAWDVEIVETHHARKEDAPSGTALELGRAVARGRGVELDPLRRDGRSGRTGARDPGEIAFHALRGGDVTGEHAVHFLGLDERLTLAHAAANRDLFARGALAAARWLAGREPGRYHMAQVLGLDD